MIVLPDVSKVNALVLTLSVWNPWYHLYRADIPLDKDTTITSFTEADAPGYAPIEVADWSPPVIVEGRAQTEASEIVFTRTDGAIVNQIWGYYVTNGETGPLLWCERGYDPPYPFNAATDRVRITPRYSRRGERRKIRTGL